jgi:hypothetical protein
MFRRVMLNITLVSIITGSGPQPTPEVSNAHVLDSRVTWYGASELPATRKPRA